MRSQFIFNSNKLLITSFLMWFCCIGCARNKTSNLLEQYTPIDSVMKQMLGDSLSQVILCARQIEVVHSYMSLDSGKIDQVVTKLPSSRKDLVKFLLMDSANYNEGEAVYGVFSPNVGFFFKYRKQVCKVYFDFGLRKWNICDAEGRKVAEFDIRSNEVLRFSCWLFPEDKFLTFLLNQK